MIIIFQLNNLEIQTNDKIELSDIDKNGIVSNIRTVDI